MSRTLSATTLMLVLVSGCGTHKHTEYIGDPGHPWPEWMEDAHGSPDAAPPPVVATDGGSPADGAAAEPQCTSFSTQQGAICVSCSDGGAPVVSCTAGPPTAPTCHQVEVGGFHCTVCHDASGALSSKSCASQGATGGCLAATQGAELCLVCTDGSGAETRRDCVPKSVSCKSVMSGAEICLECRDGAGAVLSKQCEPASKTCQDETADGELCLVCRDGAGKELSRVCEGS